MNYSKVVSRDEWLAARLELLKAEKELTRCHKTGYYKAPERAGISYMLSPVLRTYFDPDESDRVTTVNYPHVMYHAPGVSNEDIGAGELGGVYPFLVLHGHHAYMTQPLGVTERAAINKQYRIKDVWCLPKEKGQIRRIR